MYSIVGQITMWLNPSYTTCLPIFVVCQRGCFLHFFLIEQTHLDVLNQCIFCGNISISPVNTSYIYQHNCSFSHMYSFFHILYDPLWSWRYSSSWVKKPEVALCKLLCCPYWKLSNITLSSVIRERLMKVIEYIHILIKICV